MKILRRENKAIFPVVFQKERKSSLQNPREISCGPREGRGNVESYRGLWKSLERSRNTSKVKGTGKNGKDKKPWESDTHQFRIEKNKFGTKLDSER